MFLGEKGIFHLPFFVKHLFLKMSEELFCLNVELYINFILF
jgi:hypothetical protein